MGAIRSYQVLIALGVLFGWIATVASACGGKTVVDADTVSGGDGTAGSHGAGGSADCDALVATLRSAFEDAVSCNPMVSVNQWWLSIRMTFG